MRVLFTATCMSIASFAAPANEDAGPAIVAAGTIANPGVQEASGLARSTLVDNRYWVLNDGGWPPEVFAIGTAGEDHGSVRIRGARNVDWEDLAAFVYDGRSWLLIADFGDNLSRRRDYTLYVVEEPDPERDRGVDVAWRIRYTYPNGAMDAEAVAVDPHSGTVFVLIKRTIPPILYALPLRPDTEGATIIATRLGGVSSIDQPSALDLLRAPLDYSWHWQPTAMDFADDGAAALILTYRAVYLYHRRAGEPWQDALGRRPQRLPTPGIELAESASFGRDNNEIYLTVEGRSPLLYRIDRPLNEGTSP